MNEHVTHAIYFFEVHLIYSSVVCLVAWVLTSIPGGSATTKHWIWVATALNFILPLGALVDSLLAVHISWARPLGVVGDLGASISQNESIAAMLAVIWLVGASTMLARLCARIANEHCGDQATGGGRSHARNLHFHAGVAIRIGDTRDGPAVNGILHSQILLPRGIDRLLTERELNSVLMHELIHARRHDNLMRLIYEIALCALWFHPLVWVTGSRLALYRELSCDESVIRHGHGSALVSALSKLASSQEALLLRATATSHLARRLSRLMAAQPLRLSGVVNALLAACFAVVLVAGVYATVAHTACCFVAKT